MQGMHRVVLPVSVHVDYLAAAYRWTAGQDDWTRVVREA
jgi:hypothetical protein